MRMVGNLGRHGSGGRGGSGRRGILGVRSSIGRLMRGHGGIHVLEGHSGIGHVCDGFSVGSWRKL